MRILCIGDSLTAGLPYDPKHSYPTQLGALLSKKKNVVVVNEGVGGDTSGDIFRRLGNLLEKSKKIHRGNIDLVIFWGGCNDLRFACDHDSVTDTLVKTVELCRNYGCLLFIPTLTEMSCEEKCVSMCSKRKEINSNIRKGLKLEKGSFGVVDFEEMLSTMNSATKRKYLNSDGIHFTKAGYKLLAKTIYKKLTVEILPQKKQKHK